MVVGQVLLVCLVNGIGDCAAGEEQDYDDNGEEDDYKC